MSQTTTDPLAEAALEVLNVEAMAARAEPSVIALGAGQTAARAIRLLSEWYREREAGGETPNIRCVAASDSTETLAHDLGLPLAEFATCESVDVFLDGADEIDRELRVMKGSRGSMARERMLAWASRRNVYLVRDHKISERIGLQTSLSIAVMAFGLGSIRAALRQVGMTGVVRRTMNGELFITDNGNLVLDVNMAGDEDLAELASHLNGIPGVVDHGLFLDEADVILVEHRDEHDASVRIERLDRGAEARQRRSAM